MKKRLHRQYEPLWGITGKKASARTGKKSSPMEKEFNQKLLKRGLKRTGKKENHRVLRRENLLKGAIRSCRRQEEKRGTRRGEKNIMKADIVRGEKRGRDRESNERKTGGKSL